jgi:hypothetical protein
MYLQMTLAQRDEHRGPSRVHEYESVEFLEPVALTDGTYVISSGCLDSLAYQDRWEFFAELPTMTQEQVDALIA